MKTVNGYQACEEISPESVLAIYEMLIKFGDKSEFSYDTQLIKEIENLYLAPAEEEED